LITSCIFDVTPHLFIIQLYFMVVYAGRVESALGPWRLLLLFMASHVGGLLIYSVLDPSRAFVWSGAEAAVSGLLFAFATLYPHTSFGPNWRTSGSFVEEYGTMETKGYISIWVLVVMWVTMQPFPYFMGGQSTDFIVTWAGGAVGMALARFWRQ
jgi:membrane associated rhomboid family serine protease